MKGQKTYLITETVAVWVTYKSYTSATSKKAALENFNNGGCEELEPPEFGDSVDGYDSQITCEVQS